MFVSISKSVLVLSVLVVVGAVAGCKSGGAAEQVYEEHPINHTVSAQDIAEAKNPAPIKADRVVLWVNGLGCPLCASNIDRQLERVKGVETVMVDLSVGKVSLGLTPGKAHPSPAQLGEAVEDAGFTLVKVDQE